MNFKSKNLILLTGAGFTHNFGGFLGREMWSKIFNNPLVQAKEKIRNLLLDNFDFEDAYSNVFSQDKQVFLQSQNDLFDDQDRKAFSEAIEQSYKDLDNTVKNWSLDNSHPEALNRLTFMLGEFLKLFFGSGSEKGFMFTLNQDLFMERKFGYRPPGVQCFSDDFYHMRIAFERNNFVKLPDKKDIDVKKNIDSYAGIIYIKLHGSYGWLSADNQNKMVIGKNKLADIIKEPLLNWYYELFKQVIKEGGKKFVIIGYGFRDQHINEILLDGVKNHRLKLYIINPSDPEELKQNMKEYTKSPEPGSPWQGVASYFPYTLRQIFPSNQIHTTMFEEIKRVIAE